MAQRGYDTDGRVTYSSGWDVTPSWSLPSEAKPARGTGVATAGGYAVGAIGTGVFEWFSTASLNHDLVAIGGPIFMALAVGTGIAGAAISGKDSKARAFAPLLGFTSGALSALSLTAFIAADPLQGGFQKLPTATPNAPVGPLHR